MSGALLQASSVTIRPLTATGNKSSVSGSDSGFTTCSPGNVTSDLVTVSVVGGTPPYTYAWAINDSAADGGPFTPSSPTSNATSFSDQRCATHADNQEIWRCTVTDDNGKTDTVDVTVTLTWADLS